MAVQVAIKEAASGTETAAAAKAQLVDLEQKLEAASQREAALRADVSKVCMPSWALPWPGRHAAAAATWLAHAEAPGKPVPEARLHCIICHRRALFMQAMQDVLTGHAGITAK